MLVNMRTFELFEDYQINNDERSRWMPLEEITPRRWLDIARWQYLEIERLKDNIDKLGDKITNMQEYRHEH